MSNRTSEAFKAWWAEQPSCDYDEMIIAKKAWDAATAPPVPSTEFTTKQIGWARLEAMKNIQPHQKNQIEHFIAFHLALIAAQEQAKSL